MNPLDETLQIETPENISFGYAVAGIGSRFLAALIDTLLIFILQVVANLLLILLLYRSGDGLAAVFEGSSEAAWLIAIIGLISFLFLWGYYIFFEMLWNGQSPGKRIFRLRVIRADGTPITLTESVIRNLVRLVDFLPAYYGVGVVTMFVSAQSRRLGDLAANTLVVHENPQKISLQSLARSLNAAPPPAAPSPDSQNTIDRLMLPVDRLREEDVLLAESFLARRDELKNRHEMAIRVARSLLARMSVAEEEALTPASAERTLLTIVETYRNRGRETR